MALLLTAGDKWRIAETIFLSARREHAFSPVRGLEVPECQSYQAPLEVPHTPHLRAKNKGRIIIFDQFFGDELKLGIRVIFAIDKNMIVVGIATKFYSIRLQNLISKTENQFDKQACCGAAYRHPIGIRVGEVLENKFDIFAVGRVFWQLLKGVF